MRLKHIKLFESFEDAPKISKDIIFDWLPFDAMENDPIQKTIPASLTLSELEKWLNTVDPALIEKAGLFISHEKVKSGGFTRSIATKLSPISFDVSNFNPDFEIVSEFKNVNPSKISGVVRGASFAARLGVFRNDKEE